MFYKDETEVSKRIILHSDVDMLDLVTTHSTEIQNLQNNMTKYSDEIQTLQNEVSTMRKGHATKGNFRKNNTCCLYFSFCRHRDQIVLLHTYDFRSNCFVVWWLRLCNSLFLVACVILIISFPYRIWINVCAMGKK